ncbi:RPII140-upstream gene protein [Trichogramma pretiosum]|uniref:RPII140-upstream gene protein n=1 Tax=Trichogramma pretiosum TaxID=7493 RepID=UPI0006C9A9ED|nr:RPII140-upstream gene protein [Trichogramma pretiosum]
MIFRVLGRGGVLAFSPILFETENPHDKIADDDGRDSLTHYDPDATGWQRIRSIFKKHKDYTFHPDLVNVVQTAVFSYIVGGLYGGVMKSREAFIKFIETNEATQFRSHLDAKRQLSDKMFIALMKGANTWGPKVTFFTVTYTVVTTGLQAYYNKHSILFYILGGSAAGAVYKSPLGLRGMVSGAVFGGFFGSIYGGLRFLVLKGFNMTEEDFKNLQYQIWAQREEAVTNAYKQKIMSETMEGLKKDMLPEKK